MNSNLSYMKSPLVGQILASEASRLQIVAAYCNPRGGGDFFHLCFFVVKPQKNKYRWFKVEGFGDGLVVVGKFRGVRCPLSQRVSCVKLRKTAVAM